ncbi:homoserine kinase, partial [Francisella tularensis subsp. holarctica]|nr:homoserine kinase [Francisella tularensis subsp. holarctica]
KKARELLKDPYDLYTRVEHSACLAATISALYTPDIELLGQSLKDILIEPRRSKLITGYYDVQKAAYATGAIACGISGSG